MSQQQRKSTTPRSITSSATFLQFWILAAELFSGCRSYQSISPLFSPRQKSAQRIKRQPPPRWQPRHIQQCHSSVILCLARRRPEYDDFDDEEDDYYWPENTKQSSSSQERPVEFSDSEERARRIESNPKMDFRNMEEEMSSKDPIERYNNDSKRRPTGGSKGDVDRYYDDDNDEEEYYDNEDYNDDEEEAEEEEDAAGNFWSNPPGRYDPVQSSSKPKRRVPRGDEPAPARRRRPRPNAEKSSKGGKRKKSTFRSGTPAPPPVIGDIYNQLFWYGFDPADTTSPADKTMFGGTKGKFNGLAFLDNNLDPKPKGLNRETRAPNKRRPPPPQQQQQQQQQQRRGNYYEVDEDDEGDFYDGEETFSDTLERLTQPGKPSSRNPNEYDSRNDADDNDDDFYGNESGRKRFDHNNNLGDDSPSPRSSPPKQQRQRRARKNPWEEDDEDEPNARREPRNRRFNYDDDNDDNDDMYRASNSVSNWFRDDNDDDDDDDIAPRRQRGDMNRQQRSGRRQKQQQQSPWASTLDAMGNLFGGDKKDMSYEAKMYNRQMGLGSQSNNLERNGRSRRPRPERQGRGYAYRYDADASDDYDNIVDADIVAGDEDVNTARKRPTFDAQEIEVAETKSDDDQSIDISTLKSSGTEEQQQVPKNQRGWEERALAMERIPPPDVPAWGPSGDLGMDARMKATIDALQDIQEAQYKLEQKKKREQEATDDITILKVDVGVQKRRMAANKQESRMIREDIRNLDLEIEDAARSLRKARDQVQFARDRLAELEDRNWALLGLYSPDQAGEQVEEALREFEANEPAARKRVKDTVVSSGDGGDSL